MPRIDEKTKARLHGNTNVYGRGGFVRAPFTLSTFLPTLWLSLSVALWRYRGLVENRAAARLRRAPVSELAELPRPFRLRNDHAGSPLHECDRVFGRGLR